MSHSLAPPGPSACPNDNQLALYQQRQLPEDTYLKVEQHVEQCPLCTELLVHLAHVLEPGGSRETPSPEGQWLGHYQVQERLGKGGMGNVFVAFDSQLQRRVAIKLVRQDVSQESRRLQLNKRLLREARALAALNHPHVLSVYEIGEWHDQVFVVMQLVDGVDLRRWLAQESPSWLAVTRIFLQIAKGLMAAHAAGIVHRDLKPDNILITQEHHPYLADFGLVANHIPPHQLEADPSPQALARLTQTGMLVGTPGYIAPEIYSGKAASPQADQFSFCVSLFEALFQHKPHVLEPYPAHIRAIALGEFLELPGPELPPGLEDCLRRGMAPDPAQRFADMARLTDALERCIQQQESAPTQPERPAFDPTEASVADTTSREAPVTFPKAPASARRQLGLIVAGVVVGLLIAWAVTSWRSPGTQTPSPLSQRRGAAPASIAQQPRSRPKAAQARLSKSSPSRPRLPRQTTRPVPRRKAAPTRQTRRSRRSARGRARQRRRKPVAIAAAGSRCAAVATRYRQRNKRGWDAFSDPKGRALWQHHALCLYQKDRCAQAFGLDKQYISMLAKRPQNEAFYAFRRALRRCRLQPFVQQLASPLQRSLRRVTPYYKSGLSFCQELMVGLLRRHHRRVKRLSWADKERWEALMKVGLRCLALPLKQHRISAARKKTTCRRLKRAFGLFQSSLPRNDTIGVAFRKAYRSCVGSD